MGNTLAAWAPAVVSLVTAIFMAGMYVSKIKDHDKRLDRHENTLGVHAVEIAEHKAWRDGYNAAQRHG